MTHSIKRIFPVMAVLLAATLVRAQAQPDDFPEIRLKTNPTQVRAGQQFELIGRVSVDNAEISKVFVDCADAFGPEHTWEHDGGGVFEFKVTNVEETPGLKEYELWTRISNGEESRFMGESFKINVATENGDQDLERFLSWMKDVGYSDEVIRVYAYDGANPVVRDYWRRYFAMRKEDIAYRELKTMPIVFIDVLATDEDAINEPLAGQTSKLEEYMTRIFGKSFDIEYVEERVSYESLFGKPTLQKNSKGKKWLKFNPHAFNKFARAAAKRIVEERQLPRNAVMIHWAAKKWKHEGDVLKIEDHTGSGPAFSGMDFGGFGLATYAHEWGHGQRLGHMFVVGPGSYASRTWGLDCVMNHTYVPYSNKKVGRLLSPLPRYALEPKNGYLDQKTFAATYSESMAGTEHLERRLKDTKTEPAAVSTMTWSTPWNAVPGDSVICKGFKNRNFEIKKLELQPGIAPGTYSLFIDERAGSRIRKTLVLRKDGEEVASTPVAWRTSINHENHYDISLNDYLSLTIGRPNKAGGSTLYGIGQLLNDKPLVVPASQ